MRLGRLYMKIFKKICLLSFCLLTTSATNSYLADSTERDIVRRYHQELLSNARYNNYKDYYKELHIKEKSRRKEKLRKALQRDIDKLKSKINYCNDRIGALDYKLSARKGERTRLDGKLAELMCLEDLGDPNAKSGISNLKKDISLNEDMIENYESQKNAYASKKISLEYELRKKQRELSRL